MSFAIINEYNFLRLSHEERLVYCAKRDVSVIQNSSIAKIIELCVSELKSSKLAGVTICIVAMMNFLSQPDEYLASYLKNDRRELIQDAFDYYDIHKSTRAKLARESAIDSGILVEMNDFIHNSLTEGLRRINSLSYCAELFDKLVGLGIKKPGSSLYSLGDLREISLLHYALRSTEEKMTAASNFHHYCGHLLARMDP